MKSTLAVENLVNEDTVIESRDDAKPCLELDSDVEFNRETTGLSRERPLKPT